MAAHVVGAINLDQNRSKVISFALKSQIMTAIHIKMPAVAYIT